MASISKRGKSQWRALVRRRGYPQQSKTFSSRAEAEIWARDIEGEMDRGVFVSRVEAETTTLRDAFVRYENEVLPEKRSQRSERYKLHQLAKSDLADRFLASLRGADLARWRDERLKTLKPATVNRELALISHVYTVAIKDWGMESLRNPVAMIRRPKENNGRNRRLQPGEEQELLARAEEYGQPLPAIILLALETAMRRGEIAGLTWQQVDLKHRMIHLPITKNGDPRDVPLSTTATSVLQEQEAQYRTRMIADEGSSCHITRLIARARHERVFNMRADAITKAFSRITGRVSDPNDAKRRAGLDRLENLRFHDLRHEATSRLFEKGLSVVEVQAITGHKTLTMLSRYTHLKVESLLEKLG